MESMVPHIQTNGRSRPTAQNTPPPSSPPPPTHSDPAHTSPTRHHMNLNSVFPSAFLTPQSPRAAAVASQHRSGSGGGEGGNANRWSLQQPTSLQAEAISPDGVSVGSGWKADSPGGYASIGEDTGQYNIGSTSAANRPASGVFRQVLQAPEKSRFGISSNSSSSIVEEPVSDYYVPGMTPRSKPQFHPFSTNISHSTPPGGALDSNTRRAFVASVGLQKSAFRTEQGHNQTGIPYPDPDPQPYLPSHVRQLSGASLSADSRTCHRASESSKLKNTSTRKETSMDDPIFSATTVSTIGGENELLRERSTYTPMSPRRARPQIDGNWASRGGPSYKDKDLATNESNDGYPMEPVDRSFNDVIHPSFKKPVPSRRYKRYHNYQLQDTTYFCHGRLLSGGDNILPFLGSIILLLGLGGLWIGTTGVWVWRDGLGGGGAGAGGKAAVIIFGYVLGVCFGAMMATALRDPGILPRGLDPVPHVGYADSTGSLVPLSREIRVRKGTVSAKYCETCKTYRAPRSSHCRLCGNCVEGIDHHCTYLHNCIGRRNYTSFITFLVSAVICLVYSVVFAAIHYALLCHREGLTFAQALGNSPESAVNFMLGLILLGPVSALLGYHFYLMFINATTIERLRHNTAKSINPEDVTANPFSYNSHIRNFIHMLCRPQSPSWIDASGWETADQRIPNPGLVDQRGQ